MTFYVYSGAKIKCSFGTTQGMINALPGRNVALDGKPMANIGDSKPMVNIKPCGMCRSITNPTVAAATSAAMGALTPMPCIPNTTAPWMPGKKDLFINGMPALLSTDKLMCMWGGVIQIA